jgi:tetratricopeptide (TPR) repeat protein
MLYRNLLLYEREAHGEDWPGQLGILSVLTRILLIRGETSEAILWLERGLVLHVTLYGAESPPTAQSMLSLASALRKSVDTDQHLEAEQLYLQAIEILYKCHGSDGSADVATAILSMGMCVERIGRLNDARQAYEDSLVMRRKHLGNSHADTGDALLCLAALLSRTWETSAAMVRYEQALEVFYQIYGSQHPRIELVKDSLATLLRQQAKEQWEQSLFGEACVSSMAADRRVAGNAIVSGYFYKKEPGPLGIGTATKKLFAAIFPVGQQMAADATNSAARDRNILLLWAYDADMSSQGRALPGATVISSVWRAIKPAHTRVAKTGIELYGEGTAVAITAGAQVCVGASPSNDTTHRIFSIIQPQPSSGNTGTVSELFSAVSENEASLSAWSEAVTSGRVLQVL